MDAATLTAENIKTVIETGSLKMRICWSCKTATYDKILACSGCCTAYYCNKECQRKDWSRHASVCKKYAGNNKLVHQLDAHAKSLTMSDLPSTQHETAPMGFVVQIKNTKAYLDLLDNGTKLSGIPRIDETTEKDCFTIDKETFVSFWHHTDESFIENYAFILYLLDFQEDIDVMFDVFQEQRDNGHIPVVVYSHDLRHYCVWYVDQ